MRAKSQLGVSLVGDLSNESYKAGRGGGGFWGCHGAQIAHYHHKKHLLVTITRISKGAWCAGLITGPTSPPNHEL